MSTDLCRAAVLQACWKLLPHLIYKLVAVISFYSHLQSFKKPKHSGSRMLYVQVLDEKNKGKRQLTSAKARILFCKNIDISFLGKQYVSISIATDINTSINVIVAYLF